MRNVRRIYEVSTGHLPEATARSIDAGTFTREPAMTREYGWLFTVPEDQSDCWLEVKDACPALFAVMCLARDADCDWVLFDRDVPVVDYLPTFPW